MKLLLSTLFAVTCLSITSCDDAFRSASAVEHEKCVEYGFRVGTPEYGNCRIALENQRMANARALMSTGAGMMQAGQPRVLK